MGSGSDLGLFFGALGLAVISQIWLSLRVGRSNTPLAIATFFIGFPAAVYTFFRYRADPEKTVSRAFIANIFFLLLLAASWLLIVVPLLDAQAAAFDKSLRVTGAARPGERVSAVASASAIAKSAAASALAAASAPAPAASAVVANPIEAFSAALRESGLKHSVTRMAAAAALPSGVIDAALFSVESMSLVAGAASAASAAGTPIPDIPVTLFSCESAEACRSLAGAYLQLSGAGKRRILQNGLMLLSLPPVNVNDADLTPAAVASVFRKL